MTFDFLNWMARQKEQIDTILKSFLPDQQEPNQLNEAMHYAVLNHGKRIRPLLVIAAANLGNPNEAALHQAITAVEFIHSYSLIHDDLPSMDNDSLRHGKPTCHIQYGEAIALLAGDALQALAFDVLVKETALSAQQSNKSLQILAQAVGFYGMCGGQALDWLNTGKTIDLKQLETMHIKKTGALITASVLLGLLATANYDANHLQTLHIFAEKIGLSFQIIDDILDYEATTEELGKTAGKDAEEEKATFVNILGIEKAKEYADTLVNEAIQLITPIPKSQYLIAIAKFILSRKY